MDKKEKLNDELYLQSGKISSNQTQLLNISGEIKERAIRMGIISLIVAFDVGVCHVNSNEALNHAVTVCGTVLTASQIPNVLHIVELILSKHELKKETKLAKEKIVSVVGEQVRDNLLDTNYNIEYLQKKGKAR